MSGDTANEVLKPQQSVKENNLQQKLSSGTRKGPSSAFLGAVAKARASIAEKLSKNKRVETATKKQSTELNPAELERAIIGREQFEAVYDTASPELKAYLLQTGEGVSIQAMFLGIKPSVGIGKEGVSFLKDLNIQLPENYALAGEFVYDKAQVGSTIAQHPEVFDNFQQFNGDIEAYLRSLSFKNSLGPQSMSRTGVILGYPKDAVMSYARNYDAYGAFIHFSEDFSKNPDAEGLTESEVKVLTTYGEAADKREPINPFPFQKELRSILEKKYPDVSEEGRNFILTAHQPYSQGFEFISGNPTMADMSFNQKVEKVFEQSGMNNFVTSQIQAK